MAGSCFLLCSYGGSGVSTLVTCAVGVAVAWGKYVLNMAASYLRAFFCLSPRCGMGLDGVGFCRASVRSSAALVTASTGDGIGKFFCTGNSSVMSDTCYDAVLGM